MARDKRQRLVEAAKVLLYRQGMNCTTLADIANEARVPLGNVYYYFKTKSDIGAAVLDLLLQEQKAFIRDLDEKPSPKARLAYFLEHAKEQAIPISAQGSRIGSLCQELGKQGGLLADLSASIFKNFLLWMELQFGYLGFTKTEASGLSLDVLCQLEGCYLLGFVFKEPKLITQQITLLQTELNKKIAEKIPEAA